MYTAFAVLHGGAFPGGFGPRHVRGWFSTGDADPIRPPAMVAADAQRVRNAGFDSVLYREFPGGHELGAIELAELIRWWLGDG
jgi:predicted esterase